VSTIVRTKTLLALPLALVLLGAACGGDEPAASPTVGTQSSTPEPLPTSSPGGATGTVTAGNATIQLSHDLTGTVQLLMLGTPALYSPPPGSTALTWTDGLQTMTITGTSFTGPLPTSDSLSLSLSVRGGTELVALVSTLGECTITVTTAQERSVAGSFTCAHLAGTLASGDAVTVDASGTYAATG
jgi:phosphotransferase system HPr-like phosphotransfer protein